MQPMMFINVPTRDLSAADSFYGALGFEKNPVFSNEEASCWKISETLFVMVLHEEFYSSFLRDGDTPNLRLQQIRSLHALRLGAADEVEEMAQRAVKGGGSIYRPVEQPMEGMVDAAVKDPDGHVWELGWMDPGLAQPGGDAHTDAQAGE